MHSKRRTTRPPSTVDGTKATPLVESTGASIFSGASSTSVLGGEFSNSQRDLNKATFIINLGGSDSDKSSATSTVSKTGTSSSVSSSTSSASDQEQNSILEVSSVSTDSGLSSSDAPPEIETPPTEEENPVEEQTSNTIYKRHMYLKKHGFPLWIPQPNMRLPRSYRRRGVSIGDVGIFTSEGGFDFLFNICLPAGHPSNPDELPEGFSRLDLKPVDVCEFRAHSSHSYLASPSVQKQGKSIFQCSDSDGALLVMPQGAHDEDLRNISRFRDYASLHAESWYEYANGPCGREIGNEELHLVTGCDKTTSWGIAAYSHVQSKSFEDNATQLSFSLSNESRHSSHPTFAWDQEGAAEVKAGPEDDELMDAATHLRNQCTFIRSLTPALGHDDWERLQAKVAASAENRTSMRSPKNRFASVLGAISSLPGRIGSLRGHSGGGTSKSTDSMTTAQRLATHPATYVIDMLRQKCPRAKVIVAHDSDWSSVIRDSDNDWMPTSQDLHHRIQEAFDVVEQENGTVYLQEKIRSPEQPNMSSHISIKLEDKDLLLGDRKAGFYPLPDPFETSPSDNKADSPPRSFKKLVDDWNDGIKPNTYLDSSDDDDDDLDDEDNSMPDVALLKRIFHQMNNRVSFKESSSPPRAFKTLDDDSDDDTDSKPYFDPSEGHLGFEIGHEDSPWSDAAFLKFISSQIQKMKNNSSSKEPFSLSGFLNKLPDHCDDDNKSNQYLDSGKSCLKLDTDDLDNKDRIMLDAFIKVMFQRMKNSDIPFKDVESPVLWPIKKSVDDCDDDSKPNVSGDPSEADSGSMDGFVPRDARFSLRAPGEDYPMLDATFLEPTFHKQRNADSDVVMFNDDFSASSKPGTPPFKEPFVRLEASDFPTTENASHHDPESFSHIRETNRRIPTFYYDDKRNIMIPLSMMSSSVNKPQECPSQPGPSSFRDSFAQLEINNSAGTANASHRDAESFTQIRGTNGRIPTFLYDDRNNIMRINQLPRSSDPKWFTQPDYPYFPRWKTTPPRDVDPPFPQNAPANPTQLKRVASVARIRASQKMRKQEARFTCLLCGQTFTTNANLKSHTNAHLGLKNHRCSHCLRAFTTKSSLRRHLKICKALETKGPLEPM